MNATDELPAIGTMNWHGDCKTWFKVKVAPTSKTGRVRGETYARRWGRGFLLYNGGELTPLTADEALEALTSVRTETGERIYAGYAGDVHAQLCLRRINFSSN
jgi:hypothetical protein